MPRPTQASFDARDLPAVLSVEGTTDTGSSIVALVRVSEPRFMRSSAVPGLAEELFRRLPGLRRHRCECGSQHGIEAELADTELPHLLEHIALELMVRAGAPRALRGETRWDFAADGSGVFRVSLAYADSESGFEDRALAESAIREGAQAVGELVRQLQVRT